jgi:transposase
VRKRQLNDITRIDIPKDTLDAHRLAGGQRRQVLNCIKGFAELFKWIGSQSTTLIVFEATGPYHRQRLIPFAPAAPDLVGSGLPI